MRKNINKKNKSNKLIIFIIVFLFVIFISSSLIVSSRNYFITERLFKRISSSINTFFINNCYSDKDFNSNILSSKISYLEEENNRLRDTIALSKTNTNLVMGKVINHNALTWYNFIEINKGYDSGIIKDNAVISSDGLIGFISKTSKYTSEVKLLTDINNNSMLSVVIKTNDKDIPGVLCKYDYKKNVFIVKDVMYKDEILAGSKVVLSDFNSESNKGIYIGSAVKESTYNYGLSKVIEVESSVNFDDLMYVSVIGDKK